jgi:LysR family transcriptional regulator, transcriptional activator for dmlA
MNRKQYPLAEDLHVFLTVIRKGGFATAAEELGQSPAYVSKRIQILENTLQAKLLHRTTRRVTLAEDGEKVQRWAIQILNDFDELSLELSNARSTPSGLIHICSTFGFGRNHVAPAIALLSERYPELEIRLELFDRTVDIVKEGFDLEIRIGDDIPEQHICKKLVSNQRVLCASPDYLKQHGIPTSLDDLVHHDCLTLKERNMSLGVWQLMRANTPHNIKVNGPLSSNNGEIIVQWAISGRGIMLRSLWDVKPLLDQGKLVQILPEYTQDANVWGVYPTRPSHSAKLRVCMEFLQEHFLALSN